jgi:hypothetical protein
MTTSNTTTAKQQILIDWMLENGTTIETITEWFQDPIKRSMLNVMAEGFEA